jgi:hypothetical protein
LYKDSSPWAIIATVFQVSDIKVVRTTFFLAASIVTDILPAVRKISSPSSAGFFEPETGAY